jgi:hypothetical protein
MRRDPLAELLAPVCALGPQLHHGLPSASDGHGELNDQLGAGQPALQHHVALVQLLSNALQVSRPILVRGLDFVSV